MLVVSDLGYGSHGSVSRPWCQPRLPRAALQSLISRAAATSATALAACCCLGMGVIRPRTLPALLAVLATPWQACRRTSAPPTSCSPAGATRSPAAQAAAAATRPRWRSRSNPVRARTLCWGRCLPQRLTVQVGRQTDALPTPSGCFGDAARWGQRRVMEVSSRVAHAPTPSSVPQQAAAGTEVEEWRPSL